VRTCLPHYVKTLLSFEGGGECLSDGSVVLNEQDAHLFHFFGPHVGLLL
jgi:hypothetical protein